MATGPAPTLPNGTGGWLQGEGNSAEPILFATNTANYGSYTTGSTVTTTELLSGLLSATLAGGAANLTLPTAALLDAAVPNAVAGLAFEFGVNSTTNTATIVGGTGVTTNATGAGSMAVAAAASARFRIVKTGDAAWSVYRVG